MSSAGAPLRVAVTLEQCWHRIPGGTATSTLTAVDAVRRHQGVRIDQVGVSAWHRRAPSADLTPTIPVHRLPLARPVLYDAWHRLRWPPVTDATGPVDVIHATAMAIPPPTSPIVVTVHDLAFLDHPERSTARGLRFFRRSWELTRRFADLVVVPSEVTAAECVAAGFDPGRIRVVPWAVDMSPATEADIERVRAARTLPERYVLWIGTAEPRKNLDGLLRAWRRLAPAGVSLLLGGGAGWGVDLEALIAATPGVRHLGPLSAAELPALYAAAEAFCFPSHREGFGLPVLEAMAQGTPVITSSGTATEEVAGDAALLVDPADDEQLAEALADILVSEQLRARLGEAGRVRARSFSTRRLAASVAAVYEEVAVAPVRRVGVDLLWLVPGEVGGTETYATRLLEAWEHAPTPTLAPVLLVNRRFAAAHPDLAREFPMLTAPVDGRRRVNRVLVGALWLPWITRRADLSVMHHLGGTLPPVSWAPTALTVHDLQPLSHPETFSPLKLAYLQRALPRSVQRATVLTTLSQFVRQDLIDRLGVDPRRVRVVPPGFDSTRAAVDTPESPGAGERWESVARRFDLVGRRYFLYPAITYGFKNHAVVVDALALLDDDTVLVLTAGEGPAEADLRRRIDDAGVAGRVRRTGWVDPHDLVELFAHATALVFPSLYEGFGLPVLEAMDLGCPVLAAADTGLTETVGEAGVLLDPTDASAWAAAMRDLLHHPERRDELRRRGARRVAAFRWEWSAQALADTYAHLLVQADDHLTRP